MTRRPIFASMLVLFGSTGCAMEQADVGESDEALFGHREPDMGAVSCDFTVSFAMPPEQIAPTLERDRMHMAGQPGMERKQIPLRLDPSGFLSGGRYLFETVREARDYLEFVESGYTLAGVRFLERPEFSNAECHAWRVIGHADFANHRDHQVVMRTERFSVPRWDQRHLLRRQWPSIRAEAQARGFTAVSLQYDRRDSLVQLVYYADRVTPYDPTVPDFATLATVELAPPLGDSLHGHRYTRVFDRTSWVLTVWHPFIPGDLGEPSNWPHSPPLPQPYCGDAVCEVSRGEDHASCGVDCAPNCGDAVCQEDEDEWMCPGDCPF